MSLIFGSLQIVGDCLIFEACELRFILLCLCTLLPYVPQLLQIGCSPISVDLNRKSVLYTAVFYRCALEDLRLLVQYGANPFHETQNKGKSPNNQIYLNIYQRYNLYFYFLCCGGIWGIARQCKLCSDSTRTPFAKIVQLLYLKKHCRTCRASHACFVLYMHRCMLHKISHNFILSFKLPPSYYFKNMRAHALSLYLRAHTCVCVCVFNMYNIGLMVWAILLQIDNDYNKY